MNHDPREDRLLELLADRALFGLSAEEEVELQAMLVDSKIDADELDRFAGDLARAFVPQDSPPLPATVRAAILAADVSTPPAPAVSNRRRTRSYWPVAAIAACVMSAIIGWWFGQYRAEVPVAQQRDALIADANSGRGDAVLVKWDKTADPAAADASGDVVWSNVAQRGFMRFHNLAPNDPRRSQYQLWVFDAERDEKYPVDGGVFDIPATGEDVIVPIRVKLPVNKATLFAVTVEPPGGVVVSNRQRLPLLAKIAPRNAG